MMIDKYDQYRLWAMDGLERGLEICQIPPRMHGAITSYVIEHRVPGPFLQALLKNNLSLTTSLADQENLAALPGWINFLHCYAPHECHGSEENYEAWIKG